MAASPHSFQTSAALRLARLSKMLERLEDAQDGNPGARQLAREAAAEVAQVRDELASQHAAAERARLDGALLVARTAAHQLNNALAPVVGYAELLAMLPGVRENPTARSYAAQIGEAAGCAAELVQRLQRIVRLEETPSPLGPDKPILDLDRSAS